MTKNPKYMTLSKMKEEEYALLKLFGDAFTGDGQYKFRHVEFTLHYYMMYNGDTKIIFIKDIPSDTIYMYKVSEGQCIYDGEYIGKLDSCNIIDAIMRFKR